MKIAVISDTHNRLNEVYIPSADVLIHCGDMTNRGTIQEVLMSMIFLQLEENPKEKALLEKDIR